MATYPFCRPVKVNRTTLAHLNKRIALLAAQLDGMPECRTHWYAQKGLEAARTCQSNTVAWLAQPDPHNRAEGWFVAARNECTRALRIVRQGY